MIALFKGYKYSAGAVCSLLLILLRYFVARYLHGCEKLWQKGVLANDSSISAYKEEAACWGEDSGDKCFISYTKLIKISFLC